ncbi:MAG: hypothetical protein H6551_11635 [Chitinophagales bacterium]|nr:hypothetical protein [Chitinophagaceae bacterium]MCB9065779.1 hypothetical protein [Chitinophagales bacterium]
MLYSRVWLMMILCVCVSSAYAQHYPFYNLGVENGLIQSQVTSMAQDKEGHLWVGTYGGVSRYDGNSFTNYTVRKGLLSNTIQTIATDKNDNLWIGGPKGLSRYDGKNFQHYLFETPENNSSDQLREIKVAGDNTIWCYTNSNVYTVRDGKTQKVTLPDTGIVVTSILPYNDTLLVSTNNGKIFRRINNNWDTLYYHIPGLVRAPLFTTEMYRTTSGHVYVASRSGFFEFVNDTIKAVRADGKPIYNIPFISIAEDNEGAIWLGSAGAYRIKNGKMEHFNRENGFSDNAITSIITDNEGNVWFGSDGQGLYRFSGSRFSIMDESTGLASEQVVSVASTPKGRIYIGTYVDGLYSFYNNQINKVPFGHSNVYITSLAPIGENDVWIGTNGLGLWHLKGGERVNHHRPEIMSNTIISLYKDTSGRLWIGTGYGAMVYKNGKFENIDAGTVGIMSFVTIGQDSVLMATSSGLQLYHDGSVTPFTTGTPMDKSGPQCLAVQGRNLWVGTRDNGIVYYNLDNGKHFVLNNDNGLQSDFIYNIIEDNNKNIWVGTGFGIHKIEMRNGQPEVTFYGKEQGIKGMESNHNAATKTPDGSLWFGTMKGLVHIDPEEQLQQPSPTNIVLQSIKLFGDDISDTTYYDSTNKWYGVPYELHLPYKKNNITFTFRGISLSGADRLLYRYRMQGLEAPVSDWTNLNSITYSALPPGKYKLHVECKATNGDEIKSLTYPFEIITPFHKTRWFSIGILALCILAGITIQYILNVRKQNRLALVEKLRREEQAKVRQRTAEDFHDEVGNKLTRINVLTNVLKQKLGPPSPDTSKIINQIQENTQLLYSGTRDILWSLQPENDNLLEIVHRIRDFGTDLFDNTNTAFKYLGADTALHSYKLPLDMSRNLVMICKEAMNNALKYSGATEVKLQVSLKDDILHLMLSDNGTGFNVNEVTRGNGLNNMRNRTKRLDGKLYIDSKQGSGTSINLHFKLKERASK